jgi:hypothetical protein
MWVLSRWLEKAHPAKAISRLPPGNRGNDHRSNLDAGMSKYLPPLIFQCGGRSHAENRRQMEG